jgi:hypothetical protein
MRLYHWSPMREADDLDASGLHESIARHDTGHTWTGVPLAAEAPDAGPGLVFVVDIPDDVVQPFEVADGRYVVPAAVVRPYPAVAKVR